jgi:hypothetical protein
MKRYLIFIISLLAIAACNNGKTNDKADKDRLPAGMVNNPRTANGMDTGAAAMKPTMDFNDTLHDFGVIHENEMVEHDFTFTNNGKTPLYITSAFGSCGCTVPEYPRDAIAPGKSAVMKVTLNSAGKSGHQEKSVTIHANTVRSLYKLYIKADIEGKK